MIQVQTGMKSVPVIYILSPGYEIHKLGNGRYLVKSGDTYVGASYSTLNEAKNARVA